MKRYIENKALFLILIILTLSLTVAIAALADTNIFTPNGSDVPNRSYYVAVNVANLVNPQYAWSTISGSNPSTNHPTNYINLPSNKNVYGSSVDGYWYLWIRSGNSGSYTYNISQPYLFDNTAPSAPSIDTQVVLSGGNVVLTSPVDYGNTAWLAKSGTSSFSEGPTMTKLSGDGRTTLMYAPINAGTYYLYLVDAAGNVSSPSSNAVIVDTSAPSAVISASSTSPCSASNVTYTIQFDKDVVGFDFNDITVVNGFTNASRFTTVNARTYQLIVSYASDGEQTIAINSGVCTDKIMSSPPYGVGNNASSKTLVMDRTAPAVTIAPSISGPTNAASIIYTITFSEDVTGFTASKIQVVNGSRNDASFSALSSTVYTIGVNYSADGNQTVNVNADACYDLAGNSNTPGTVSVFMDRTPPTVSNISGNPTTWVNTDVTLVVNGASDSGRALSAIPYSFDGGATWQSANSKTFSGNQTVNIQVRDAVGNVLSVPPIKIDKIDKTAPTIIGITGNPSQWQKADVTLSIDGATDSGSGLSATPYSFDGGATWQAGNSKTFSSSQVVSIQVRDATGNICNAPPVLVNKIDKSAPTIAGITGIPTTWQNAAVTLTISGAADSGCGLDAAPYSFDGGKTWQDVNSKTYSTNQTVYIQVRDALGNIYTASPVVIDKIDITAPTITGVTGNPTSWQKADVVLAVIGATDPGGGLGSTPYSFDGGATWQADNAKSFSSNQTVNIQVRDAAGNVCTVPPITITKIDKTPPTITGISGNVTSWQGSTVTLTINGASDSDSGLSATPYSFDGGATWQASNSKSYSSNQNVSIQVRDNAGNIYAAEPTSIDKIDKSAPTITSISGNPTTWQNTDVTLTVNGAIDKDGGLASAPFSFDGGKTWQSGNSCTFSANQTVYVQVRDANGNVYIADPVVIEKIDKTAPTVVSVTGNPVKLQAQPVTLTVDGASDSGCGLAPLPYSFDGGKTWQATNSSTFDANQTVNIQVRDALGNTASLTPIVISKIYVLPDIGGGSGSGSSGGSGSISGSGSALGIKLEISTIYNVTTITARLPNTAFDDPKVMAAVIDAAKAFGDDGDLVIVNFYTGSATSSSNTFTVNGSQLASLSAGSSVLFKVGGPNGSVRFDAPSLESICSKYPNADLKVTISQMSASDIASSYPQFSGNIAYTVSVYAGSTPITTLSTGEATVTIPYTLSAGEDLNSVAIYDLSSGGQVLKNHCVYNATTKTDSFITTTFSVYGAKDAVPTVFSDVSGWYEGYVAYLSERGIMIGTDVSKYSPNMALSRSMVVKILANMAGADLSKYTSTPFSDVKKTDWFFSAVSWASANGITVGYNGKFSPYDNITRQDFAVMLKRYAKFRGYFVPQIVDEMTFNDSKMTSDYAVDAVALMQMAGIISGRGDGNFAPRDNATRAEASKMAACFMQLMILY